MEAPRKQVAIITGSSSGIGLATCNTFLSSGGWLVFGVDRSPAPDSLTSNPNFKFAQSDITVPASPAEIISGCKQAFGPRIDALLNVAAILDGNSGADAVLDEHWEKTLAVNLTAPVRLIREVLKVMKDQKSGSIVNVSSKAGMSGAVSGVAYTASKHGLIGVTKNTAWLYKDDGIRCNAICPGAVASNISTSIQGSWDAVVAAKTSPVLAVHIPTGSGDFGEDAKRRMADPEDAAGVLYFLASDASRGVNGAIIPVDNAWSTI